MRFVIGKRWKNDKSKEFLLFYWLVLDICSTDFFISIARSFKIFLATEKDKTDSICPWPTKINLSL